MTTLETRTSFTDWLDEQAWLEDAWIDDIAPLPTPGALPETVRLVIRLQTSGSLLAGEKRHVRELTLTASHISRFELPVDGFSAGNCCHDVYVPSESHSAISLVIDVPMELHLDCARLVVVEREWDEIVPEWFSDREFYAIVRDAAFPSAEDWIQALKDRGLLVAWRNYGGLAATAGCLPAGYEGWFLQEAHRVQSTTGGVFFFSAAKGDSKDFRISVQLWTKEDKPLYLACANYLGSFHNLEIHCGNVILSGPAWLAHIAAKST